jgi:hypothetical protein
MGKIYSNVSGQAAGRPGGCKWDEMLSRALFLSLKMYGFYGNPVREPGFL